MKEDRGSGEGDAFLRNILFSKLPERSPSFPFQRPLCLLNACLPFFDTARLLNQYALQRGNSRRTGGPERGTGETLSSVLIPNSFRLRETAPKEAREAVFEERAHCCRGPRWCPIPCCPPSGQLAGKACSEGGSSAFSGCCTVQKHGWREVFRFRIPASGRTMPTAHS